MCKSRQDLNYDDYFGLIQLMNNKNVFIENEKESNKQ